jgi:hypothetical protein
VKVVGQQLRLRRRNQFENISNEINVPDGH